MRTLLETCLDIRASDVVRVIEHFRLASFCALWQMNAVFDRPDLAKAMIGLLVSFSKKGMHMPAAEVHSDLETP
jgi:hypothetical protein